MEYILVVGAGFMGSGIAQVHAQAGYGVHLIDIKLLAFCLCKCHIPLFLCQHKVYLSPSFLAMTWSSHI